MFRNYLFRIVAPAVVALALTPFTQVSAATWNAYTYVATPKITSGTMMKKIAQQVTEQTGEELTVALHYGGSLPIQATNITQAISRGAVIQLGDDGFPYGNIPIAGTLNLPMLLTTEKQFETAIEIMRPHIEKAFAEHGIELLAIYHYPQQVAWSSEKLTSLADLEGMKMRVTSPQQAAFVEAFGGIPVTLGTPEVAPALQRGVVEGVFTASSGGARTWGDMLSYNYRLGPNYFASFIIANKQAFEQLDSETQKTVRSVAQELSAWATEQMKKEEKRITQEMAERGMTVTEAKAADIKEGAERMASYWEQWAKEQGSTAVKILDKIRAAIGK